MTGLIRCNRGDELLGKTPALTTAKGDEAFAQAMAGRRYPNAPTRPLGGRLARPEPLGVQGGLSSLSANHGTAGGPRRVHWAGTYIR